MVRIGGRQTHIRAYVEDRDLLHRYMKAKRISSQAEAFHRILGMVKKRKRR